MAKNASLVLDLGCNKIKFGFAGEPQPRVATRAYFGEISGFLGTNSNDANDDTSLNNNRSLALQRYKFGDELRTNSPNYEYKRLYDLKNLPKGGYMNENPNIDTDLLCNLYNLELCPSLNVSPNSLPLLIGEPNNKTEKFRKSIVNLVEQAGIPKIFVAKKGLLNAYSRGLSNAMIFESGAISSSLVVVEDGYVHQQTFRATPFGGDTITDEFGEILDAKTCVPSIIELDDSQTYTDSYYEYFKFLQAEDIKHSLLSLDPTGNDNGQMEEEYALPDGETITLNEDDQKFCKRLFSKQRNGIEHVRMKDMLLQVKTELENSKIGLNLMKNVVVTGGNTITPYFNNLVENDLNSFAQEHNISMEMSACSTETASRTSWIGGAILGSLLDFDSFYITKQQVEEQGIGVFDRNCP